MNIAITIPDIYVTGGAERVAFNLSRYLSENHNVSIVSLFSKEPDIKNNELNVIHCNLMRPKNRVSKLVFLKAPKKYLIELLNSFDLVISNNVFRYFIHTSLIKTKSIDIHHLNYEESGLKVSLKKRLAIYLRNRQLKNITRLVVLTSGTEEKFREAGLNNVTTIPNGLSFFPDISADLTQKQVIAIGRLHFDKGYDNLIKAWSIVNSTFPDWRLVIYGEGTERENLENLIIDFNLSDSISMPGSVTNIVDKIIASSIFVMTSHYEGFGMTIIESMSCGLPIISFDCPTGPREVLDNGKYGLLAENQNTEDFAEKLILLMGSYELRQEYGRKARERALDYSWEKIGPLWDNLLDSI
jgi:glycosyltransferase involved in cell wall biosynthesis